jgi:hypothetical protein
MRKRGNKKFFIGFMLLALVMSLSSAALADNILVTQYPWGYDDGANMTAVFGAGNFTTYSSFASATPAAIFNASNRFVMLEGGASTDTNWYSYLNANSSTILGWVTAGGRLLLKSAGWDNGTYTFGPASLILDDYNLSSWGTLTAAGIAAFTFQSTPVIQGGNYLAHNYITGTGLTSFMDGDDPGVMIVAGTNYGAGYIMYAGLTASKFHNAGDSLVNDVIWYTANTATVPIPGAVWLLGSGLVGLAGLRRKFKR